MTHEERNSITQIAHERNPQKAHKRNTRIITTHGNTYTVLLYPQAPPTVSYTKPQSKKRKKGSRDFPFVAGESSPPTVSLVTLGPDSVRGRRTLSGTSRPDARVLCATGAVASLPCLLRFGRSPSRPLAWFSHNQPLSLWPCAPRPTQRLGPFSVPQTLELETNDSDPSLSPNHSNSKKPRTPRLKKNPRTRTL